MRMPKEYVLVLIIGLYLLAYLLEAVVDPLAVPITTPYQYLSSLYLAKYPFSSALIFVRAIAITMTPLWFLSFIENAHTGKAVTLLIVATLIQLYAVQALVGGNVGITIEWSISLAIGGIILFIPMLFLFARGAIKPKPSSSPQNIGSLADDDDDF